jgi:subfamily B ATP-binding cassette protein MsbA
VLKKQSDNVQREQGFFLFHLRETLGLKSYKGFNAEERMEGSSMQAHNVTLIANQLELRKGLSPVSEFVGFSDRYPTHGSVGRWF